MSDESIGDIRTAIQALEQETADIVMAEETPAAATTSLFSSTAMQELNFRVLIRKSIHEIIKNQSNLLLLPDFGESNQAIVYHHELQNVISLFNGLETYFYDPNNFDASKHITNFIILSENENAVRVINLETLDEIVTLYMVTENRIRASALEPFKKHESHKGCTAQISQYLVNILSTNAAFMIQRELNNIVTKVAQERNLQNKVQLLAKIYSRNQTGNFTKFISLIPCSYMWLYQFLMEFGDSATLSYTSAIVPYYNQWMKQGQPNQFPDFSDVEIFYNEAKSTKSFDFQIETKSDASEELNNTATNNLAQQINQMSKANNSPQNNKPREPNQSNRGRTNFKPNNRGRGYRGRGRGGRGGRGRGRGRGGSYYQPNRQGNEQNKPNQGNGDKPKDSLTPNNNSRE